MLKKLLLIPVFALLSIVIGIVFFGALCCVFLLFGVLAIVSEITLLFFLSIAAELFAIVVFSSLLTGWPWPLKKILRQYYKAMFRPAA